MDTENNPSNDESNASWQAKPMAKGSVVGSVAEGTAAVLLDGNVEKTGNVEANPNNTNNTEGSADSLEPKNTIDRDMVEQFDRNIENNSGRIIGIQDQLEKTEYLLEHSGDKTSVGAKERTLSELAAFSEVTNALYAEAGPHAEEPTLEELGAAIDGLSSRLSDAFMRGDETANINGVEMPLGRAVEATSALSQRITTAIEREEQRSKNFDSQRPQEVASSSETNVDQEIVDFMAIVKQKREKAESVYLEGLQSGNPRVEVHNTNTLQPLRAADTLLQTGFNAGRFTDKKSAEAWLRSSLQELEDSAPTGRVGEDFTQEEYDTLRAQEVALQGAIAVVSGRTG